MITRFKTGARCYKRRMKTTFRFALHYEMQLIKARLIRFRDILFN